MAVKNKTRPYLDIGKEDEFSSHFALLIFLLQTTLTGIQSREVNVSLLNSIFINAEC